jgi:hypothetical protein
MRKVIIVTILITVAFTAQSQKLNQDSIQLIAVQYYFQVQSGSLFGCNSCPNGKEITFSGSTTHGVKVGKKLRVGGSVGLDSYYGWNILPVYGSVSYDFLGKKNTFFAELNYGTALITNRQISYEEFGYKDSKGGRMSGFRLGYRMQYDDLRVSFGVGQKTQQVTYYYEYPTLFWDNGNFVAGDSSRRTIKNEMNRFMIWMAVGWR